MQISDEMVEEACKALVEKRGFNWPDGFSDEEQTVGRDNIRAALEAALCDHQERIHYAEGVADLAMKHRDEAEAALSAAEPSVADEPIGEVIPYRGPMCQLTNYRELKLRVPVGSLEVGTKLFAHPPALTAQVQDVAEDPDVLWTCNNNMSNMFFGPGATENENEVVWDFAAQSWANANIKLTVSPAPAKQEG